MVALSPPAEDRRRWSISSRWSGRAENAAPAPRPWTRFSATSSSPSRSIRTRGRSARFPTIAAAARDWPNRSPCGSPRSARTTRTRRPTRSWPPTKWSSPRTTPELGEVVVRGRLVSRGGETLAGFRQTTRLRSGSRILELLVELDPQRPPEADPWDSYYAVRFAWPDQSAELYRDVNAAAVRTELVQFESPHFVEIRTDKRRTTLLGGGLPWHCRRGGRKLDTLLIVAGETCRRFRFGLGLDLPNPLSAALEFLAPATTVAAASPPRASGWLFHLDVRNVVANDWEATPGGFRVRLLESEGRRVRGEPPRLRPLRSARKTARGAAGPEDLPVEGDRIEVDLRPYEWVADRSGVRVGPWLAPKGP